VGKKLPLSDLRWLNTRRSEPIETEGRVTLVRWWTNSCPYCTRSLPVIQGLRREYGARFQTVAVYHPKPVREVPNEEIVEGAIDRGYRGPIAADDDWKLLRKLYLRGNRRVATSVSFLLDESGTIRFVHPGPDLRPTDDPKERQIEEDYRDLRRAIEAVLAEQNRKSGSAQSR
jgi:hypothetical protein